MSVSDLDVLLARLPDARVAVVGDLCVDAYWDLDETTERSIETGLPVRVVARQRYGLGGAGNVVANLAALGTGGLRVIGVHGSDPFGRLLRDLLMDLGVELTGLLDAGNEVHTAVYAKPFDGHAEQERLDFGTRSRIPAALLPTLTAALHDAAAWASVVVVNQQLGDGPFTDPAVVRVIDDVIASHPSTCFVVDARDTAASYGGAVLKLNVEEAAALGARVGGPAAPTGLGDVAEVAALIEATTGRPVFVTLGEHGIVAVDGGDVHRALGVDITDEVDPVGAGDTVVSTIAAMFAAGGDVGDAATYANLAASVTVRQLHTTGTVTPDQLRLAAASPDLVHEPELAANPARARYVPGTQFEVITSPSAPALPTHVIFDHDGTLSTLRQGWEQVMEPMMIGAITGGRAAELDGATVERIRGTVRGFIDRTTGIQTLVQMQGLVDLVRRFGLVPPDEVLDEHGYKERYNADLIAVVRRRRERLDVGHLAPEDFHIKNALPLLERLHEHGVTLHLASGTDEADVVAEAEALGFGPYFEGRIHGAVGDVTVEAKREVMDRILLGDGLDGASLATFGDGPVEMRETRKRGGYAIGVCSDETRRFGFNPDKRARLIRGGACVLVPDYSDLDAVLGLLELAARPAVVASRGGAA